MKAQHTPGPWNTGDSDRPVTQFAVFGANNKPICRIASHPSIDEGIRNGALIAAAPELLATLESILNAIPCDKESSMASIDAKCRAAIAKARGYS